MYGYLLARCWATGGRRGPRPPRRFLPRCEAIQRDADRRTSRSPGSSASPATSSSTTGGAAREERKLALAPAGTDDRGHDVDERFERSARREVLDELGADHRAALTLRYLDGLSVPEVADQIATATVHATEALLVRARQRVPQSHYARR